jgi:hypothetical protein
LRRGQQAQEIGKIELVVGIDIPVMHRPGSLPRQADGAGQQHTAKPAAAAGAAREAGAIIRMALAYSIRVIDCHIIQPRNPRNNTEKFPLLSLPSSVLFRGFRGYFLLYPAYVSAIRAIP